MRITSLAGVVLSCVAVACGGGGGSAAAPAAAGSPAGRSAAPTPEPSEAPDPRPSPVPGFRDDTLSSNIRYDVAYTAHSLQTEGVTDTTFGGAAAGDCDRDGDVDLFVTSGDQAPNRLFINQLNNGLGTPLLFADQAVAAGVANSRADGLGNDRHSGPIFADMDGDGDLDLFLGGLYGDSNRLYRNRGDCRFEDVTEHSGLAKLESRNTVSAAFGDYDLDGDLDLFLTHWGSRYDAANRTSSEHLFRNDSTADGEIRFADVSTATGVTAAWLVARARGLVTFRHAGDFSFTPTFARINDDLWPDILIASDYGMSQLLISELGSSGWFRDASESGVHTIEYGMGSAVGDYDSDGDLDWFVTSIYSDMPADGFPVTGNRLLRNPGGDFSSVQFENVTDSAGVANGQWGWGACFLDIDNDGDLDIYHTNGWQREFAGTYYNYDRSRVFLSDGHGEFAERAADFGLDTGHNGRGVVCADFDNDGDVDILELTDRAEVAGVLWNNVSAASGNNSVRVRLIGLSPNTEAAGARIFVSVNDQTQMREVSIGSNYTSQNPTVQVFGLGSASVVRSLRVEWPALLPGPEQPAATTRGSFSVGVPGSTLVICHPELDPRPAEC